MVNRIILNASTIKVSKPGVDVLTASTSEPDNFILDSQTQSLGIFMTGELSITASAMYSGSRTYVGQTLMFPYDLGYIPYVMIQQEIISGEAMTYPTSSESWRYPDPDLTEGDYYAVYVYPLSDRLRFAKWGTVSPVKVRYAVFFAKQGEKE